MNARVSHSWKFFTAAPSIRVISRLIVQNNTVNGKIRRLAAGEKI
jgi:hypothetical protein